MIHLASAVFIFIPLLVLGARGGWQYRPIDMITASNYAQGKHVSLVLNTPSCIMKSANKAQLQKVEYFPPSKAQQLYQTYHKKQDTISFQQKKCGVNHYGEFRQ
jgi:hypothetical protein